MAQLSGGTAPQERKRRMIEYGVIVVLAGLVLAVSSPVIGPFLGALVALPGW